MKNARTPRRLLAIEVDRLRPRGCGASCDEVVRAEGCGVRAIGAEVVVDDIEEHRETQRMRGVDERRRSSGVP